MSLCIIMLEPFFVISRLGFLSSLFGLCRLLFFPIYGCCSSRCFVLGNINRSTRGGSCSQAGDDAPVHRSARQVGHSPKPYQPPPPPPQQPPTTEQIMRMFEERRNQDLLELLRSVQAMVGQNGNQYGNHSKLSDF